MLFHFVTVPTVGGEREEEELNRFLGSHRVVAVERQFVNDGPRSAWAVCVTYLAGASDSPEAARRGRVDYRETLPPEQFARFAKLRDLRRRLAEREGLPAFAIFTNDQLAEMVRRQVRSGAELAGIEGIGAARVEKYGGAFLELLQQASPEAFAPAPSTSPPSTAAVET